jgi:hypothetical protein
MTLQNTDQANRHVGRELAIRAAASLLGRIAYNWLVALWTSIASHL